MKKESINKVDILQKSRIDGIFHKDTAKVLLKNEIYRDFIQSISFDMVGSIRKEIIGQVK